MVTKTRQNMLDPETPDTITARTQEVATTAAALAAATAQQTALRTERERSDVCLNPQRFNHGRANDPTAREILDARIRRPALETDEANADVAVDEARHAHEVAIDRLQEAEGAAARAEARVRLAEAADLVERLEAVNTELDRLFLASQARAWRHRLPSLRVPLNGEDWRASLQKEDLWS